MPVSPNGPTATNIEIVGVVNDTRYEGLSDWIPDQVFLCYAQRPGNAWAYVRTSRDPDGALGEIRAAVSETGAGPALDQLQNARSARETGIRMALGAGASSLVWLVLREVLAVVGAGVGPAIPAAVALAGLIPASRAARSDPVRALRES